MLGSIHRALVASLCAGLIAASACGGQSESDSDASGGGGSAGETGATGGSGNVAGGPAAGGTTASGGSDSTGGSAGSFSTDLPPDTVLGGLSEEQYLAVCQAATDYLTVVIQQGLCSYIAAETALGQGQTDEQIQMTCAVVLMMCEQTPVEQPECTVPEQECTATVEEMEACVNDISEARDTIGTLIPGCEELTTSTQLPDPSDLMLDPADMASCTVLEQKCPGILPDAGAIGGLPSTPGAGGTAS